MEVGVLVIQFMLQRFEFGRRLADRNARFYAGYRDNSKIFLQYLVVKRERCPELFDAGIRGKVKSLRHHADHSEELTPNFDGATDYVLSRMKPGAPEFLRQDDDLGRPRFLVDGSEVTTHHRTGAKKAKKIRTRVDAHQHVGTDLPIERSNELRVI